MREIHIQTNTHKTNEPHMYVFALLWPSLDICIDRHLYIIVYIYICLYRESLRCV